MAKLLDEINQLKESLSQVNQSSIEENNRLNETLNELNATVIDQNQTINKLESECGWLKGPFRKMIPKFAPEYLTYT